MTEIIFCRTRHVYDSYTDFWKLVELSGFPTIYVDEIDITKEGCYITAPMNGDYRLHIENQHIKRSKHTPIQAHLILWNLERPSGSAGSVPQYAMNNRALIYGFREDGSQAPGRYVDEVWVSDRRLADETSLRFVPLGSDKELGKPSPDKKYDFVHMSSTGPPRRQTIYKEFNHDKIGPNCWPVEESEDKRYSDRRDEVLKLSRFALNVHQDQHPFQEPLRFALFAAYGIPIISEVIYDLYPYGSEHILTVGYDSLITTLKQILHDDYRKWRERGLATRDLMCNQFQFGKMVRRAVDESLNKWR